MFEHAPGGAVVIVVVAAVAVAGDELAGGEGKVHLCLTVHIYRQAEACCLDICRVVICGLMEVEKVGGVMNEDKMLSLSAYTSEEK